MIAILTVVALTAAAGSAPSPRVAVPPARFNVTIDTTGASVVLAAALSDPAHAGEAAEAALANTAVQAMIAKMAKYDQTVTPEAFKRAVVSLANGGSGEPFDLARLRADPGPTRRMLVRLAGDQGTIAGRIADRLQSFTPDGLDVHARLFVLVGAAHQTRH
jgi:hypothetical protein